MKFIGRSTPLQTMAKRYNDKENLKSNFCTIDPNKITTMKKFPKFSMPRAQRFSYQNQNKKIEVQKRQKKFISQRKRKRSKGMKFQESQRINYQKQQVDLPGPFCYQKSNVLLKTAPSVSFQYKYDRQSFLHKEDNNAGPGDYDTRFNFWKKGVKFNRQKKQVTIQQKKQNKKNQLKKFQNIKKIIKNSTFGKAVKKVNEIVKKNNQPGPGSYLKQDKVQNNNKNDEILIQNKNQITKKQIQKNDKFKTPGPAKYHLQNEYNNFFKKGIKIYKSKRFKSLQLNNFSTIDPKSKRYTSSKYNKGIRIYKQKYDAQRTSNQLGPGEYNLQNEKIYQKSYTFNRQKKIINDQQVELGPGSYDTKLSYKRKPKRIIFNKQKLTQKLKIDKRQLMDLRGKFDSNKLTFGKQKRFKEKKNYDLGPAYYNIQRTVPSNQPWLKHQENKLILS